jgi:hypothetical protein
MKVKKRRAAPGFHGPVEVEKRDGFKRLQKRDASGAPADLNQTGFLQLRHDVPDDHGVAANGSREHIARDLLIIPEVFNRDQHVHSSREFGGNLHRVLILRKCRCIKASGISQDA